MAFWATVGLVVVLVAVGLDQVVWSAISSRFGPIPGEFARVILVGLIVLWAIRRGRR
jgi:hypothetical protein